MTRNELAEQLQRLSRGFKRNPDEITAERLDAFFERFGHIGVGTFTKAVTKCLREPNYPGIAKIEGAVEGVEGYERANKIAAARTDETLDKSFPFVHPGLMEAGMAALRFVMAGPCVPEAREVADVLKGYRGPEAYPDLERWIERLEHWPEGRNYPLIPDDEAVFYMTKAAPRGEAYRQRANWWTPGAVPGKGGKLMQEVYGANS